LPAAYHIAQYNIARLRAPLDAPPISDFVAAIDTLNNLADTSKGFVWRHQDENGNSTSVRVRDDPLILINFSVWEDIDSLFHYAYYSDHAAMFRRRREFFEETTEAYLVLWWIPAGHRPSIQEAEERLDHLRENGPSPFAFGFKSRYPPPAS
jgi:hypothetical protein